MSERNLPDWLDAFMLLTENSEPPTMYKRWCGISAIASALMRKVSVNLGLSLTIYPNFYVVLVGPSATGKGTAMRFAYDIMKEVHAIKMSAQATSLQALIRRMKDTNLTDINIESGETQFHSSLTILSEEFTVFLGYHNRELMAALCDWYDCKDRWTYDTIKRDKEEVVGVWVNILAGTTPENIKSSLPMEAIGGGLTSRIIFVNEERRGKIVVFPAATPKEYELQTMLIHDLEMISLLNGQYAFTENALNFYADWCFEAAKNPPFQDAKFDGYMGRRRNHLVSLAMVCSASRKNNLIIDEYDITRASQLLKQVEIKMGTVFRGIGKSDIAAVIHEAIMFIQSSKTGEIPLHQFARRFEGDVDKLMMDRILTTLEAMKYVKVIRKPGDETVIINLLYGEDRSNNERTGESDETGKSE